MDLTLELQKLMRQFATNVAVVAQQNLMLELRSSFGARTPEISSSIGAPPAAWTRHRASGRRNGSGRPRIKRPSARIVRKLRSDGLTWAEIGSRLGYPTHIARSALPKATLPRWNFPKVQRS